MFNTEKEDCLEYEVWVDDERLPRRPDQLWVRSLEDFKAAVKEWGCPSFISFDHDLGYRVPEGYDIVKWLVHMDLYEGVTIPENFRFECHTANPIGKKNMEEYLNNYLEKRRIGFFK